MYLFYVVDGLDIKKIEKKMNIFVPNDFSPFFPDFSNFFRFVPRADLIPIAIFTTLV